MKLALLVARHGSKSLGMLGLSEEDESLILLAIRSKYTSPVASRRGMSSVLWSPKNGEQEEDEEDEDEEDGDDDASGSSVSGMRAETGRAASPSTPMNKQSRSSSNISETDDAALSSSTAAAGDVIGSPQEASAMPLSAICAALKAELALEQGLGVGDTVEQACQRLGVERQNNLKLDAAAAYNACVQGPRSAGGGKRRVRATSDWSGPSPSSSSSTTAAAAAATASAGKSVGRTSQRGQAFVSSPTHPSVPTTLSSSSTTDAYYDEDEIQRSASPSGPIHVPDMITASEAVSNPSSVERERHKTLSYILPATALPALKQVPGATPAPVFPSSHGTGSAGSGGVRVASKSLSSSSSPSADAAGGDRRRHSDSSVKAKGGAVAAAIHAQAMADSSSEEEEDDDEDEDDDEEDEEDEDEEIGRAHV
jgi:hypothetical protein